MKKKVITINDKFNLNKLCRSIRIYRLFYKKRTFQVNYEIELSKKEKQEIEMIIELLNIKCRKTRLEKVYDLVCEYIDEEYIMKNHCEFDKDQCYTQKKNNHLNGCCSQCPYLINNSCVQNSIACKLYFCYKIRVKKKCPRIKDIKIMKYFLSPKEKFIFSNSLYETKETTIANIMKTNILILTFKEIKRLNHKGKGPYGSNPTN